MSKSDKLLSVREVADRLALKPSTIRRRILERRIAYVKIGRAVRIPSEAVDRLIEEGWREPVKGGIE